MPDGSGDCRWRPCFSWRPPLRHKHLRPLNRARTMPRAAAGKILKSASSVSWKLRRLLPLQLGVAGIWSGSSCTIVTTIVGKEKRDVYKFDRPFAAESPAFRRSAEALGFPMVEGNHADLLRNGDEIFPAMTRDIRNAGRTVNLETYIFQPDEAGRQFADAMIAAAKNGVEVRLLVDSWGSKLGDLEKPLKDAGVRVRTYRPVRLFSIYKVGRRTHRKILVVDGAIAYT